MKAKKEIYLGADHAGFELKEKIKEWLLEKGYKVHDIGARFYERDDDYPIFAEKLGREIMRRSGKGILICGSAEGVCIAANKMRGVRAVAPSSLKAAQMSREHNDANVLCLSGWWMKKNAVQITRAWLKARFIGSNRHVRRINQISKIEKKMFDKLRYSSSSI